jgi:2-iminobutanoate/2-iminopropanoate deaminase
MEIISSKEAPAAIGPYSQAVAAGSFVFISGQLGLDASGKLVSEKTEEQADAILRNMKAILNEKGLSLSSVAKTTILRYMPDILALTGRRVPRYRWRPFQGVQR